MSARLALALALTAPLASPAAGQFVEAVKVIHEIRGEAAGDQFGWIARRIPDADGDGDGIADFCVSAPTKTLDGKANCGRIYVYSGKTGRLLWKADGPAGAFLGINVESAGDVDGDGAGDVIAGAPGANAAFVYSGTDGRVIHRLSGATPGTAFGRTVALAGDVDRDGHGDLLVGSPRHPDKATARGRVDLVSGKDGTVLRGFEGEADGDLFGSTINGFSDAKHSLVVIGAQNAGEGDRGRVHVFDGRTGERSFVIEARETGKNLGRMFASVVGDVNGDGTPDVYASDWEDATRFPGAGRIYVSSGADGQLLFTKHGEAQSDGFGIGNGDAGDVNGDGRADLIIGAWQHGSAAKSGGRCYLIDGSTGGVVREFTCDVEGDTFGFDTTGLGDVDGDGTVDLLITSAWSGVVGKQAGRVWVISSGGAWE